MVDHENAVLVCPTCRSMITLDESGCGHCGAPAPHPSVTGIGAVDTVDLQRELRASVGLDEASGADEAVLWRWAATTHQPSQHSTPVELPTATQDTSWSLLDRLPRPTRAVWLFIAVVALGWYALNLQKRSTPEGAFVAVVREQSPAGSFPHAINDEGLIRLGELNCSRLNRGESVELLIAEANLQQTFNDSYAANVILGTAIRNLCSRHTTELNRVLRQLGIEPP